MYSKDGYKRNSKDRNNPFNIVPSGNITMEDVDFPVLGIDNLGYSELMMPGATYTFPGNEVFEIPATRGFINYDTREGNIIGGLSHTSNNVTLTANGVLPYGKLDPYQFFKGALGFGIEGRVGDTSFGIGVDKPFVSNPFTGEGIYTPIQPKIKIKHSFEEGGDLPKAQLGIIKRGLQALKNVKKGLPAPEFPLYKDRPVILGKDYGTSGNPFVYHRTDNITEKLDWEFLKKGTTPGYLEELAANLKKSGITLGTPTHGRYKGIWGFNSNYPIHANPVGGYEPWLSSRTLDPWGKPGGYGHRILQYQFRPNAKILDLSDRETAAIIKNAKHHQALLDQGYDAILGKNETILLNANSVDNVYEMRNLYDQEMLKEFPDMFPVFKYGEELPKAQSGLFKAPFKFFKKYFGKTVDDIPVSSSTLSNKIDLDKTFSGNTTSTISKFSDEIENPNKLSIDNIEGDLIRRIRCSSFF